MDKGITFFFFFYINDSELTITKNSSHQVLNTTSHNWEMKNLNTNKKIRYQKKMV